MTSKRPSTYKTNRTQRVSHEIPSFSFFHPGTGLVQIWHQSRKPGPVTRIQKHAISCEANCCGRKTCRGGNLSKKDADMSWKLIRPWSHTHTLACAQYLAKPCKWRTPISLNAQASAGKGWSRRNLEALDASKKAFHWAFEIGDSGSSQAKSRWLQSSPPAKWGWTKCPLYVATPLSYYLWIGTENAAARATYVQTAPKTWSISQLYINWAVGELFFVHKIGGVPHEHPSVLLPPPACGQKSHIAGRTDVSPVWPLDMSSSKSFEGSMELDKQPEMGGTK